MRKWRLVGFRFPVLVRLFIMTLLELGDLYLAAACHVSERSNLLFPEEFNTLYR